MEQKQPVEQFYYSQEEWDRLGCGPLPPERDVARLKENKQQKNTEFGTNTKS